MLMAYRIDQGSLIRLPPEASLADAVWIDLVKPTRDEERLVESVIGAEVPTLEEMSEIEPSSRLYVEGNARFLTATMLCHTELGTPKTTAVTFIVRSERLVTVRYDDPRPFAIFCARAGKPRALEGVGGDAVLNGLLDTVIDRIADILEKVGDEIDGISRNVFNEATKDHAPSYKEDLRALGKKGDLVSKARESLVSFARIMLYLATEIEGVKPSKEARAIIKTMQRDVESLAQHADYLANKIQFVLDAVLGMVSIEQNNIIKIFAVLSVVLMPPTLVASVYGMNFRVMPELDWQYGYPVAIGLMIVAGALPYIFFKVKRWL
jgi:magnesium transporter